MAYLGRGLDKISNIEVLDNITFDGSSSYSITKSSVAFTPNSAQSCLISIDGIVNATNFSVNGSTIDFGVAVPSTSVCNFFLHYGTGLITVPSDGSVTESKIGSNAVSSAKMFSGFANGITEADMWRVTANLTASGENAVTANWERVDTNGFEKIGTGLTESSGVFSFPSTGKYSIIWNIIATSTNSANYVGCGIFVTTDNSSYNGATRMYGGKSANQYTNVTSFHIFDVTNTSTHKIKLYRDSSVNVTFEGNTTQTFQSLTVTRLGDT
tara:strand:+ start:577 stop:1383 length:807 start_codon:yes stop_codon:yes gene_type:complete